MRCRPDVFVMLSLLSIASLALAQSSTSSLRGLVTDSSGAAIRGAHLIIDNRETGFSSSTQTGPQGQYQFLQIPASRYVLVAAADGFASRTTTIDLLVNLPSTLNISLSVQAVHATIQVSGASTVLNLVDASMGGAIPHATIQSLPFEGRNIPDLLSLQPGVVYLGSGNNQTHDSRSGSSSGSRSDQQNITLDGVDNNDQVRGFAFRGVLRSTLESVQEFRVTTSGFGADSGRSSGAQVSLLTRGGSNSLHGSLYEFNRSSIGEANDWFNKNAELATGLPNRPGKLIRNTFGASLGGPVKTDRAFYFANYEGQRTAENQQMTMTVPTASLRSGAIRYLTADTNSPYQLSPAQIATMDPHCTSNNTCPWGPGVNPHVLDVLRQYPTPNGRSAGDGLNTASYTWSAPNPASLNTLIARWDLILSPRSWIFARANWQDDTASAPPQFPGQPPSAVNTDHSRGVAIGNTWQPTPHLTNTLHYGWIQQIYATRGVGQGTYANFYNMSPLYAETRTEQINVPVHNLNDDAIVVHGNHSFAFGLSYREISDHRRSDSLSYNYGYTNSYALSQAAIANTGQSLDPAAFGFPAVSNCTSSGQNSGGGACTDSSNSYNIAIANLVGLLNLVTTQTNYQIARDGKTASLLPTGALLTRNFKHQEFESYLQDSWRLRPNLTATVGLRHTLLQTPYESNGQQAQPTVDMHQWFTTRQQQAARGFSVQPDLLFAPSGQARGLKPYWPMQTANLAPRIAVAWSPSIAEGWMHKLLGDPGQTSIRAGYGIYYDHFGQGIVNSIDQYGSFGLTNSITNPTNLLTPDNSPRFTGIHDLPNITGTPATTLSYPTLAPNDPLWTGFQIAHGIDDHLKTPYSHVANLSIERQFGRSLVLEASYIGRFGRHQLEQIDLAQPLNLVDPRSGQDYFSAATQMSKQKYAGAATIAPIPYFENLFPDAAQGGQTATQTIYSQAWLPGNETGSLYMLDILCMPGCGGQTNRFWPRQFASLYAWSSIGSSNSNSGQVTVSYNSDHGVKIQVSYTLSKSLDMGSDAERTIFSSSTGTNIGSSFGAILNAWNPRLSYAPSDFDVRHLVTANWVAELPVGRTHRFVGDASTAVDNLIGGWQLSGIARWTSGFPFSIVSGTGWSTNWSEKSNMVRTGPIRTRTHVEHGVPQAFAQPSLVLPNLRNPYPGEAGDRNNFRGDGYLGLDASLSKSWQLQGHTSLRFAWDVFNVSNSVRFDVNPLTSLQNMTTSGELGVYGATLTSPRVLQFSLRFLF